MPRLAWTLAPLLLLTATAPVEAGAPLICFPIEIGEAKSLTWNNAQHPFGMKPKYDVAKKLIPETLALLKPSTAVLVRMETLRRATCYLGTRRPKREALALRLLTKLQARALTAAAKKQRNALAWFDAAYFNACLSQLGVTDAARSDPFPWFERARQDGLKTPALDLALALTGYSNPDKYILAAYTGSKPNSVVRELLGRVYGSYVDDLNKKAKKKTKSKKKREKKATQKGEKTIAQKGKGKGRGRGKGRGGDATRP